MNSSFSNLFSLQGKTALVTGGSCGIGAAFAQAGAWVAITAHCKHGLDDVRNRQIPDYRRALPPIPALAMLSRRHYRTICCNQVYPVALGFLPIS